MLERVRAHVHSPNTKNQIKVRDDEPGDLGVWSVEDDEDPLTDESEGKPDLADEPVDSRRRASVGGWVCEWVGG